MAALWDLERCYVMFGRLRKRGPEIGLELNPAKCEWAWLNPACCDPVPMRDVPLVPTDKIQMLGVPLGSDEFVARYVAASSCLLPKTL
jgi:hypothetical protein